MITVKTTRSNEDIQFNADELRILPGHGLVLRRDEKTVAAFSPGEWIAAWDDSNDVQMVGR